MYRLIRNSEMKKPLKIILYILLSITCVYWLGFILYKILDLLRIILHNMTEKSHWWFFVIITIIFTLGALILLETTTDIKPFTSLQHFIIDTFYMLKDWFTNIFSK